MGMMMWLKKEGKEKRVDDEVCMIALPEGKRWWWWWCGLHDCSSRREIANSNERRRMQSINSGEKFDKRVAETINNNKRVCRDQMIFAVCQNIENFDFRLCITAHSASPSRGWEVVQGGDSSTDGGVSSFFQIFSKTSAKLADHQQNLQIINKTCR